MLPTKPVARLLGPGAHSHLLADALLADGWSLTTRHDWNLLWSPGIDAAAYIGRRAGQLIRHSYGAAVLRGNSRLARFLHWARARDVRAAIAEWLDAGLLEELPPTPPARVGTPTAPRRAGAIAKGAR